jgi:hypothetical protein
VLAIIPTNVKYFQRAAYASCLSGFTSHLIKSFKWGEEGNICLSSSLVSIYISINLLASSLFFIRDKSAKSYGSTLRNLTIVGSFGREYLVYGSPLYSNPLMVPANTPVWCILKSFKSLGTHPLLTKIPHSSSFSLRCV